MTNTGDNGALDAEGDLDVTGRAKDLYRASKRKTVAPAPIEDKPIMPTTVEADRVTRAKRGTPLAPPMPPADVAKRSASREARSEPCSCSAFRRG